MTKKALTLIAVIIIQAVVIFALYAETLHSPFLFDDITNITQRPSLRVTELTPATITWAASGARGIAYLSFALNYYFHGNDVVGYHLVNITIHCLGGIFLFLVLKLTLDLAASGNSGRNNLLISFFASLFWLIHPLQTNSVSFIVQRMNSLAALFCIITLFLYILGRRSEGTVKKTILFISALAAWLLAMGSKPIAAPLPAIILLYEWYFFQDLSRDWLKKKLPYLAGLPILLYLTAFWALGAEPFQAYLNGFDGWQFTFWQRILTEPRVLFTYIGLLLFPHPSRLIFDYTFDLSTSLLTPFTTLPSIIGITALLLLIIFSAKKERLLSFALAWFFACLALETIWPTALIFEYKTYMPSMFFFLFVPVLALRFIRIKPVAIVGLCLITALFAFWTWERNKIWHDEISLWNDVIKKQPLSARAYTNLGRALGQRGKNKEGLAALHKAQALIRENKDKYGYGTNIGTGKLAKIHDNLAVIYRKSGNYAQAEIEARQAILIDPTLYNAQITLAIIHDKKGQPQKALAIFSSIAARNYETADLHNNWGVSYFSIRDTEKAVAHFIRAIELDPLLGEAHYNLGVAYSTLGMYDKANEEMMKGMQLQSK